jgi:hypothetical protein
MSRCTGPLVISPVRDHTPRAMSRTGRTAQRPRVRAARRLPRPVPLLPARMRKGRAANTVRRPGSKGRRAAGQSPTASPDAVVQGRSPRQAAGSSGRRTRRLGRPGVLRPVTYCPPGRPPCRPPPGNFADSRAGHPAGPGMAPAQGPCPGGKDQGPCGSRRGDVVPRPAGTTPTAVRGGDLRAPGPCCPIRAKPSTTRPASRRGRCSRSLQRKGRRHHRPALPSPDAHLIGDLPPRPLAMTGRSGHQPSPPPGMSCPSRPAVPAWPFRLAGPAAWTCTRNIPSRPASEAARPPAGGHPLLRDRGLAVPV